MLSYQIAEVGVLVMTFITGLQILVNFTSRFCLSNRMFIQKSSIETAAKSEAIITLRVSTLGLIVCLDHSLCHPAEN